MIEKIKLTSVNIVDETYKKFKITSVNTDMNLQRLVNRSIDLYNTDEQFREKIINHLNLKNKNTKF